MEEPAGNRFIKEFAEKIEQRFRSHEMEFLEQFNKDTVKAKEAAIRQDELNKVSHMLVNLINKYAAEEK